LGFKPLGLIPVEKCGKLRKALDYHLDFQGYGIKMENTRAAPLVLAAELQQHERITSNSRPIVNDADT
jgi:hypothetical protein